MNARRFSNVIGFDDAPFDRRQTGPVPVVGAVFAGLRLDGVLTGTIEKDGTDAAESLAGLILNSKFAGHIRLVMLQGISLGGFNVVDAPFLRDITGLPVLVIARTRPDMAAIHDALLKDIPGGRQKWSIIEGLGEMEPVNGVYMQRVGLNREEADAVIRRFSVNSNIPEPIRVAHLIAGALATGQSRGAP
ncbi:MAG: DUF99 family protein [Thermodesulfobacteriota bacterium]